MLNGYLTWDDIKEVAARYKGLRVRLNPKDGYVYFPINGEWQPVRSISEIPATTPVVIPELLG